MSILKLPCSVGEVSDGYHTFNELYDHRCSLFLAVQSLEPSLAWISLLHDDGSAFEGWFIAGLNLPQGTVTYHLPVSMWNLAVATKAQVLDKAPKWDGHTSSDVVTRIRAWIASKGKAV